MDNAAIEAELEQDMEAEPPAPALQPPVSTGSWSFWRPALLLGGTILLVIVGFALFGPLRDANDTRTAALVHERGTVEAFTTGTMLIRLKKTSVAFSNYGSLHPGSPVVPGDPVEVYYFLGRSGRIYVQNVLPEK